MHILLLGPPGAGKGTIAQHLVSSFKFDLLSTGHMLRQAIASKTELGLKAQAIMDSGQLVSDEIMLGLVRQFITDNNSADGVVFDGFPRTLVQAKAMSDYDIAVDKVIFLDVADSVIIERMSGRRVHQNSGRVYHIKNNPPKAEGLDDITGEPLITRADDDASVVRERLDVYRKLTEPLIDYYQKVSKSNFQVVDASQDVAKVLSSIDI